jgi:hypothetical protein
LKTPPKTTPYVPGLVEKILLLNEALNSIKVTHQFGGAIALAWYRDPRATIDIDINITLSNEACDPILDMLKRLGITIYRTSKVTILRDGQTVLKWDNSRLDLFFATTPLHYEMAKRQNLVRFADSTIPILSVEDLIICKAIYDRPKDWVDIEAVIQWGTPVRWRIVTKWLNEILGKDSQQENKLRKIRNA